MGMPAQIYEVLKDKDGGAYVCVPMEEQPRGQMEEEVESGKTQRLKRMLLVWACAFMFLQLFQRHRSGDCAMMRFMSRGSVQQQQQKSYELAQAEEDHGYLRGMPTILVTQFVTSASPYTSGLAFYLYNFIPAEPASDSETNTDVAETAASEPGFVYVRMRYFM